MISQTNNEFVPTKVFFTRGLGKHKEKLNSFELALRNAGIERYNLVSVSSILPPGCQIISRNKGLNKLAPGQIVYTVMSKNSSNEPGRLIAAAIGCAVPIEARLYGYLSEHSSFGQRKREAGEYAEDLAAEMLASTLGISFDIDSNYDEKREIFKIDGRIVKTQNISQAAVCDKGGKWTTVIAAAVFVI
ncbi:pyruvoyl-dependent arginine decarboxylase [[Eubacterium] cellulosolvens]